MKELDRNQKRANRFRKKGKKTISNRRIHEVLIELNQIYGRGEERRSEILQELKPVIQTKSVKRGGLSNQVPVPVSERRGRKRACDWIREASLKRSEKMSLSLKDARRLELIAVYDELQLVKLSSQLNSSVRVEKRQTEPMQIRDRLHRAAKANRVFVVGR